MLHRTQHKQFLANEQTRGSKESRLTLPRQFEGKPPVVAETLAASPDCRQPPLILLNVCQTMNHFLHFLHQPNPPAINQTLLPHATIQGISTERAEF